MRVYESKVNYFVRSSLAVLGSVAKAPFGLAILRVPDRTDQIASDDLGPDKTEPENISFVFSQFAGASSALVRPKTVLIWICNKNNFKNNLHHRYNPT